MKNVLKVLVVILLTFTLSCGQDEINPEKEVKITGVKYDNNGSSPGGTGNPPPPTGD